MKTQKYLLVALVLILTIGLAFALPSTSSVFSTSESSLSLNWVLNYQGNITLSSGNIITLNIHNSSSPIKNSTFGQAPFSVYSWIGVQKIYSNQTTIASSNITALEFRTADLAPGRYIGNVLISNSSNPSENITTLNVTLDIPITLSSGTGYFSGNISNSSEIYYFNTSSISNVVGLRVNISSLENPIKLTVYDNNTAGKIPHTYTGTGTWNESFSSLYPLTDYWHMILENTTSSSKFSGSLELLKPSLIVNGSLSSSSLTINQNLNTNTTLQTYIMIDNKESYSLDIISVANNTNLSLNSTQFMPYTSNLSAGTVNAGLANYYLVNIILNTLNASTEGLYTDTIQINTSNGYPNKALSLALRVNLTHDIDVDIVNVSKTSGTEYPVPGNTINITVSPRYQNGTFIPNLDTSVSNFAVYMKHKSFSSLYTKSSANASISDLKLAETGSDYYLLNGTIPSSMVGGNYTFYVLVNDNNTNSLNYGTGSKEIIVNETALRLDAISCNANVSVGNTVTCNFNVTNYGYKTASAVIVTYSGYGSLLTETSGPSSPVSLGNIPSLGSNSTGNIVFNASISGPFTLDISTSASSTKYDRQNISLGFVISNASGSTNPSNSNSGTNTGAGTGNNTPSTTYALSLTSYPNEIKIEQNKSKDIEVKIKNTGSKDAYAGLSVSGIEESWFTTPAKENIPSGQEKTFSINFKIPETAGVKKYDIEFVASSSDTTSKSSSVLYVLPMNNTKEQIKINITSLKERYEELYSLFNESNSTGKNVSEVIARLIDAKSLLDKIDNYAKTDDWFSAYDLLDDVRTALDDAEGKLKSSKLQELKKAIQVHVYVIVLALMFLTIIVWVKLEYPKLKEMRSNGKSKYTFKSMKTNTKALKKKAKELHKKAKLHKKNIKVMIVKFMMRILKVKKV